MSQRQWVALLRGINVGGNNRVPMAELRALGESLGWQAVQSYIQSGNLLFAAASPAAALEDALEAGIAAQFGLAIPVIVRDATQWARYMAANPFAAEAQQEPTRLLLALAKQPLAPGTVAALQARAAHGEEVRRQGEALWIFFPEGSARSKLSPSVLERAAGSSITTRNWRTVLSLGEMLGH